MPINEYFKRKNKTVTEINKKLDYIQDPSFSPARKRILAKQINDLQSKIRHYDKQIAKYYGKK